MRLGLLSQERVWAGFPVGTSLGEALRTIAGPPARPGNMAVFLGDQQVYDGLVDALKPRSGVLVTALVGVPGDTGGDGAGKTALRIVGAIAIVAAAVVTQNYVAGLQALGTYAGTAGAVAGAAVATGGMLALNALIPLPQPKGLDEERAPVTSVNSASNRAAPYARIPSPYGRIRVTPPHGALPFTEVAGNDRYLRMLLTPGYGPLAISDIKIGETPIGEFGTDEVEYEVREGRAGEAPLTLYTNDVTEVRPNITLERTSSALEPHILTTAANTRRISIDLTFPAGLYRVNKKGKRHAKTVHFRLEYAVTGSGSWQAFADTSAPTHVGGGEYRVERESSSILRFNYAIDVAEGQYDVRATRLSGSDDDSGRRVQTLIVEAFRSIGDPGPLLPDDVAKIALRVKTGTRVDPVTCVVHSYAPVWDGLAWSEGTTSNPAGLARRVLQGSAPTRKALDDEIDLLAYEAFHERCEAEGWEFNGVFEREEPVLDVLNAVLAAGHANHSRANGKKYSLVEDILRTVPVGVISPRNSANFRFRRTYVKAPQALRLRFNDETQDWREEERIVYDDGFDEGNVDPARIEFIDLTKAGITDPDLVWREGRRRLAESQLRPEQFSVDLPWEQLIFRRGDLILYNSPTLLVGQQRYAMRVKAVQTDVNGDITHLELDDVARMETGKSYAVQLRYIDSNGDDQFPQLDVVTVDGDQTTLELASPLTAPTARVVGALCLFGEAGVQSVKGIVQGIQPAPDLGATLTFVDAADAIHSADDGPIPPFDPHITRTIDHDFDPPAKPVILTTRVESIGLPSQPDVVQQQQIVLVLAQPSSQASEPDSYQVRMRRSDETTWPLHQLFPGTSSELALTPQHADVEYELQVRGLGRSPLGRVLEGPWSDSVNVFVPLPDVTPGDLARVAGLELFGQAGDTTFEGQDVHLVWQVTSSLGSFSLDSDGKVSQFPDPTFAYYQVDVYDPATSYLRRSERVGVPEYIYTHDKNARDSVSQGNAQAASVPPLRDLRFVVALVDRFGQSSGESRIRVSNPAPAAPQGLSIIAGVNSVFVSARKPQDNDWRGMKVWGSEVSGFTPAASNELTPGTVDQNFVTVSMTPGTEFFLRVAMVDAFSDDADSLNLSSEVSVVPLGIGVSFRFAYSGIQFQPNTPSADEVTWTAGTAYVTDQDRVTTEEAVAGGSATHSGADVFLFYTAGSGVIQATTDISVAIAVNQDVVAIYKGGTDIEIGLGEALIDGDRIIANTIAGSRLIAGTLEADLLSAGTILTKLIHLYDSSGRRVDLDGNSGRLQFFNDVGQEMARIGHINDTVGQGFLLWNEDGSQVVFRSDQTNGTFMEGAFIKDATIKNAAIGDAEIDTLKVAGNAITTSSYDRSTSDVTCTENEEKVVNSGTITTVAGQIVVLSVRFLWAGSGSQGVDARMHIRRDTADIFTDRFINTTDTLVEGQELFIVTDTPGAGTFTYDWTLENLVGLSGHDITAHAGAVLLAEHFKR